MSDEKPSSSGKKAKPKEKLEEESSSESSMEALRKFFAGRLNLLSSSEADDAVPMKVIDDLTFDGLVKYWKENGFKNIITMVGAGISTSAGIPDFRSPGSGLYDNLQKYNLPHPTAIFEMDYFLENPQPFFALAKELYPGNFDPTPSHYFVRLLNEKGLLQRHYTQNIDTLERVANIPAAKLVEAHGTFYTNHCLGCQQSYTMQWMKDEIFRDNVPTCQKCNSIVKPDIVFFGEGLPEKFYTLPLEDFAKCDLLIIMGTSLEVQPFASLVDRAGPRCMRLLINRTKVGDSSGLISSFFMRGSGLLLDSEKNTRDVAFIGDCDDGVFALADGLGWRKELDELIENDRVRLAQNNAADSKKKKESKKDESAKESNESSVEEESSAEEKDKSSKKKSVKWENNEAKEADGKEEPQESSDEGKASTSGARNVN